MSIDDREYIKSVIEQYTDEEIKSTFNEKYISGNIGFVTAGECREYSDRYIEQNPNTRLLSIEKNEFGRYTPVWNIWD